jgi:hypothetical protein
VKIIFGYRVRDDGHWIDALFLGSRGMENIGRDIPWSREVCSRHLEEIQDGGLYIDRYTYGYQFEEGSHFIFKVGRSKDI